MKRTIILVLSLMLLASFTVFATGGKAKEDDKPKAVVEKGKYSEGPMLAEIVAAGELPPVDKRLPEEPVVIEPIEEIGQYGGTARATVINPTFTAANPQSLIGPEQLLRYEVEDDGTLRISPNLCDWEFTPDAKTVTLFFRKGIKWSDGAPFTADDVFFLYETMLNEELFPKTPSPWNSATMEKIDDYTLRINFEEPNPTIIYSWAATYSGGCGERYAYIPKHYMKQFYPEYTSEDKLEKLTKDAGFEHWWELFKNKGNAGAGGENLNPEMPTISAFLMTRGDDQVREYERNPYYWKVDTAGNQLPYIDKLQFSVVTNPEANQMKIIGGEVDLACWIPTLDNYSLYKQNEKAGNYRTLLYQTATGTVYTFFNLTSKDPVLRKIFQNVKFRRAMSLAINRDEINQALFAGRGEPHQMTMLPGSIFYEKEFAKAYTDYDIDTANALLDEMGLTKRDSEGFRLRPDGKRFELIFEFWPDSSPYATDICELLKEYWEAVGIQIFLKPEDRTLLSERVAANEVNVGTWDGSYSADVAMFLYPEAWAPMYKGESTFWGREWTVWYETEGEQGEEPPDYIKHLFDLWEKMKTSIDEVEIVRSGKELLRIASENLWTIGTVGNAPQPIIVSNRLRNIPETGIISYAYLRLVIYHPEQFFLKQ